MNMLKAFDDTISLATYRGMQKIIASPDSGLGLDHLVDMRSRITEDFSEAKLGRWLGWAQCAVVFAGCATIEEMKDINRFYGD